MKSAWIGLSLVVFAILLSSCSRYPNLTPQLYIEYLGEARTEGASWLGKIFKGKRTVSHEPYDPFDLVAAHRRAPMKSFLKVTNPRNGRSVVVRVVDRVPRRSDCDILVSWRAAQVLGLLREKIGRMIVEPVRVNLVRQFGVASWYGDPWHGKKTANMEIYNMNDMTAAHRFLPFNTLVRVTNLQNGRSVIVRVNDRGPFLKGRVVDLSYEAAKNLDMLERGTAHVMLEVLPEDEITAKADIGPGREGASQGDRAGGEIE
jgi:rare lipoprotein A (peptidoglycan hydrolase)